MKALVDFTVSGSFTVAEAKARARRAGWGSWRGWAKDYAAQHGRCVIARADDGAIVFRAEGEKIRQRTFRPGKVRFRHSWSYDEA